MWPAVSGSNGCCVLLLHMHRKRIHRNQEREPRLNFPVGNVWPIAPRFCCRNDGLVSSDCMLTYRSCFCWSSFLVVFERINHGEDCSNLKKSFFNRFVQVLVSFVCVWKSDEIYLCHMLNYYYDFFYFLGKQFLRGKVGLAKQITALKSSVESS